MRKKRGEHPGWSVKIEDGGWLCAVHGLYEVNDAFYATICNSKESAESLLKDYINDTKNIGMWKGKPTEHYDPNRKLPEGQAVPAWEPMCALLLHDIENLEAVNKISHDDLFNMHMDVDDMHSKLEDIHSKLKNMMGWDKEE